MKAYMDNAATTKVSEGVAEAMRKFLTECYGNPSSVHFMGDEAKEAVEKAREIIAKKLNAKPAEITFTSGGTEANNLCIKGMLKASGKKHMITSGIEHASVLNACRRLKDEGFKVTFVKVDKKGLVSPKDVEKAITKDTALVSIMHANNETGAIQPIEDIAKICKKKKVLFHTDAVQSFLKLPLDVKKLCVDALTLSAHKVHGPKGVGVAFVKEGTKVNRLIDGGRQEHNLRAGTQNVQGVVGMGRAVETWKGYELGDCMLDKIMKELPEAKLNGPKKKRLKSIINVSFEGLEGEAILLHLSSLGIAVGTGSACHERSIEVSHVLNAMGVEREAAKGAIRISLSRYNTKKEVDFMVENLKMVVESLRRIKE